MYESGLFALKKDIEYQRYWVRRLKKKIIAGIILFAAAFLTGIALGKGYEYLCGQRAKPVGAAVQCRQVAITFDDGPNPDYTIKLLKGLKKRGVKATFFVLGKEVELYPEILQKIDAEGHLIGVHSYKHVNLSQLSDEQAREQVDRTNQLIYDVTGNYANYIRPPFGCWKEDLDYESRMIEVLWDIDPRDWATDSADLVTSRVLHAVKDGSIILLHDSSESSVQAAFAIIDALQQQGYEFVTVDELIME